MVTFVNKGRMGNFLFQAACALAYGWKHQMPVSVPNFTNDLKWNPIYLQHLVNPELDTRLPCLEIKEERFTYQPLPFNNKWRDRNILLNGYWQTEKYFKDYRKEIIKAFGFPWDPALGVVSVHVRRTDYLTLRFKHPFISTEWIEKAMSYFEGYHFQFFSDDIAWCKETFGKRKDCYFSEGHNEEDDLTMMSWCEHQICSASTFSWWGAWLNQNPKKIVIMPKQWFCPGHGGLDTSDIVPKEWKRL